MEKEETATAINSTIADEQAIGTKPDTLKLLVNADAYTNLNQITTLAHREACSFPSNTTRFRSLSTLLNTCQIVGSYTLNNLPAYTTPDPGMLR